MWPSPYSSLANPEPISSYEAWCEALLPLSLPHLATHRRPGMSVLRFFTGRCLNRCTWLKDSDELAEALAYWHASEEDRFLRGSRCVRGSGVRMISLPRPVSLLCNGDRHREDRQLARRGTATVDHRPTRPPRRLACRGIRLCGVSRLYGALPVRSRHTSQDAGGGATLRGWPCLEASSRPSELEGRWTSMAVQPLTQGDRKTP
jgi:hypothetical protein